MATDPDPTSPIVIYDGVCHLCNGSVAFILRRERDATLRFAPGQSEFAVEKLKAHGIGDAAADSIVLVELDSAYTKSDAAIRIAGYLRWPWRLARFLKFLPRGPRDWMYDLIAANRYRFFGKSESCLLPEESFKQRFIGL